MSHDPELLSPDEVTEFTSLHEYDCFLRTHNGACDCQLGPVVKLLIAERRIVRTLEAENKKLRAKTSGYQWTGDEP